MFFSAVVFAHFNWDVDLVVATFLFNQLNGDLTADVSDEEPDHFGLPEKSSKLGPIQPPRSPYYISPKNLWCYPISL